MTQPGHILFRDVPEPASLQKHEVMLEIKRIGICGSDIHVFHGLHPFTRYPVVQGHEYCGVVAAVGDHVSKVSVGDKATARPQLVCGICPSCRRGNYHICDDLKVEGFQAPGVAQDYFVVPEERLVRLPDRFTVEQGAMVEPVAVAARATQRAGDLSGKNVVVFGAGTIGNLIAQYAGARDAKKVLITDLSEFRLSRARESGIVCISNSTNEQFVDAVCRVFGEEGFETAFEAAGVESTLDAAIQNIQKGGTVVIVGVFGKKPSVDMALVQDRELNLKGTLMYRHEDYMSAVEKINRGILRIEPLITAHFPFEQYLEAYQFIVSQGDRSLKVMIDL